MLEANEHPLWPFPVTPVPIVPAVSIALGPRTPEDGLPFTTVYALARQGNTFRLYNSESQAYESRPAWRIPEAVNAAYANKFSLALLKDKLYIAYQAGLPGGTYNEPREIRLASSNSNSTLTIAEGYDPQILLNVLAYQEVLYGQAECALKNTSLLVFYVDLDGRTLRMATLHPPYESVYEDVSLATFEKRVRLIRAFPAKFKNKLWLVNENGNWVEVTVTTYFIASRLSGVIDGPEIWNDPQDGSYNKVFGSKWYWWVDKATNSFKLRKFGTADTYTVYVPHSLENTCFASAAFDQAGYPTLAYEIGESTYVTYWDLLQRQYVTTNAIPLRYPYLVQVAVISGFAYPPSANILLFGSRGTGIYKRDQASNYTQETLERQLDKQSLVESVDTQGLRYTLYFLGGQRFRSALFPYITKTFRDANAATPTLTAGEVFSAWISDADVSTRSVVQTYSVETGVVANITNANTELSNELGRVVQTYEQNAIFSANIASADVVLKSVVQLYNLHPIGISASISNANTSLNQIVKPYSIPDSFFTAQIADANVVLGG